MTKNQQNISKKIIPILKKQDVIKVALFGSFAREQTKQSSDIDLLIKFKGQKTLFDLAQLKIDLEKTVGKKVDLVTYDSISPLLRQSILQDEKILYDQTT